MFGNLGFMFGGLPNDCLLVSPVGASLRHLQKGCTAISNQEFQPNQEMNGKYQLIFF
jgi:hypothetical protein